MGKDENKTPKQRETPIKTKEEESGKPAQRTPPADQEERTDYGGIPERDLKKNLGCG